MSSTNFINECKKRANANRLGKIIVKESNNTITQSNYLQNFSIDSGCYIDGNIIGSIYIKKFTGNFISLPSNINLIDNTINVYSGVKYDDLTEEYINLGNYVIERPKNEETTKNTQIIAYDNLISSIDKEYISNIDYTQGNITVKELYIDVCNQLGLIPKTTSFINSDIPISNNPFTNKEKNRIVLQSIAKISCSFVIIDNETNEIDLSWLSNNSEPDYIFEKNDYAILEGTKIQYGPINSVTIKNSQIDDENINKKNEEDIEKNGEHSIIISEDYILYNSELRQRAITQIFNRLNGLKYVDSKLITYYGKPFLKIGSKIRIILDENNYIDTYVLNHNFSYDGTFTSTIDSPALTKQEIKTKQNISLGQALKNTQIIVDKQNQMIISTTKKTETIKDELNNNYYDKTTISELLQNAETGITNTFSEAGGNNVFRNTGLWFEENGVYEYWNGTVKKSRNDNSANHNSMLLQKGSLIQEQDVSNGNYSISFYYKKLIELSNASVIINDIEYQLDSLILKQFYTGEKNNETNEYITQPIAVSTNHLKIEFKCDTDNAVEIYDLMANKGTVKLAYSQNANETTTDTVNISKGITITSTNYDVIFKANANGIKILTLTGNVVAYFTDKGLSTNEIIVEKEAQIVKTLWQEVEEQTWITRI